MGEIERDFTYNVIKYAETLVGNNRVYTGMVDAAIHIILNNIDHTILSEVVSKVDLEDSSSRTYKIIHEFYIRWRNSSTG